MDLAHGAAWELAAPRMITVPLLLIKGAEIVAQLVLSVRSVHHSNAGTEHHSMLKRLH